VKLNQFDYFRAIAILFVVFGHTAQVLLNVYSHDSFTTAFIYTLIGGSTALFVFISGFFFHYVFYKKFEFKAFMLKKIKGVYIPYLILTILTFIGFYLLQETKVIDNVTNEIAIEIAQQNSFWNLLMLLKAHIVNGSIFIQFWYIPFIMLMFIASPIFISYIKLDTKLRISIMLLLIASSLLTHRPLDHSYTLHAFIYYLPIYLLGINCSIHRESVNKYLNNKSAILGFLVLVLVATQIAVFDHVGNYQKEDLFSYNGISIMLIQKIFLIFFFLSFLQKYEKTDNRFLKEIAASSFAIFFLHMLFLEVLLKLHIDSLLSVTPDLINWLATSVLVVLASYVFAYFVKSTLKRNSKFLIGW
jgi:peptidoglycan/LPS O-acetylase OafA/YrhL